MSDQSILVTGSSGVIGTALCHRLIESNHRVIGVDCRENRWSTRVDERTEQINLLSDDLSSVDGEFNTLIHLAANSRVQSSIEDPSEAIENVHTTQTVLEYARATGVDNALFASSREVYGEANELVCVEGEERIADCANPYGASKLSGEALCRAYESCYGQNVGILRFTNVYGRFDDNNRVVPLFIAQALNGEKLNVHGAAKILDFIYIEDCVDAIMGAINRIKQVVGETINIGSGYATPLTELARVIEYRVDNCPGYRIDDCRTGEPTKIAADITKAKAVINYEPKHDLEEGLTRTINWYRDRPKLLTSLR